MVSVGRIAALGLVMLLGFGPAASAQNLQRALSAWDPVGGNPTRLGQAAQSSRPFDLTLDDAIGRALERNLDIAVERINPQLLDLTFAETQAFYRPTASFNLDNSNRTSPASTQLDGGDVTETETRTFDFGLAQPVQWGGGNLSLGWNNNRNETTNFFSSFNPSFRSVFNASYTQPLLRGFRIDNTRQQLQVTRINRDISDIDLRQTITNTVADVRNAYWELLYSVGAVRVQQEALDLAERLVQDNRARVEIGTLAPIDIVQAQSEAAARRDQLAQARQVLRTAELTLKRLIVGGTEDELWTAELNPVDLPELDYPPINIEEAIRAALDQRSDLSRANRQQEINRLNVRGLRNNTLPSLDLVGTYQLQGQGGNLLERAGFFGGQVTQVIPGGFADALSHIIDANFPTWTVGLQLSYPLGTSSADAALERARLQITQTEAQLRQLELVVATEVTTAAVQVESIRERIEASQAARELAEQQLEAEESKFEVGMSTNFFVVQAQRDLSTARDAELRAILDYQKALIEFERVQRTSLGGTGISIVGGSATGSGAGAAGGGFGGGGFGGGGVGGGGF